MTWRSSILRARKARTELPAVARPLEGPALDPGSSLTAGGASMTPPAFLPEPKHNDMFPHAPPRDRAPWVAAEFHAVHGNYPSYTERQIRNFEEAWAIAHPRKVRKVVDVAPLIYGDPKPGRVA